MRGKIVLLYESERGKALCDTASFVLSQMAVTFGHTLSMPLRRCGRDGQVTDDVLALCEDAAAVLAGESGMRCLPALAEKMGCQIRVRELRYSHLIENHALMGPDKALNAVLIQSVSSRDDDLIAAARQAYAFSARDSLPIIQVAPSGKLAESWKKALERADCKNIRFHDLRHTFATMALEHGMDVKTLSAIIGHISSATTIDIYSHVTGAMQRQAAQKIERGIGSSEAFQHHETLEEQLPTQEEMAQNKEKFSAYTGKIRKPGTGGIYELNDHLYEGRYSPTNAQSKREIHTVYAKTKEECETLLQQMIAEVRERINEEKRAMKLLQSEKDLGQNKGIL